MPRPKLGWKIPVFLIIWLALEAAAFWGLSQLITGSGTFWVVVGFILVGYVIQPPKLKTKYPSDPAQMLLNGKPEIPPSYLPRKLSAMLFMIPTLLTSLLAILVLIPPLRRWGQRKILQKLLPPGLASLAGGMDGSNPFAGFNGMGGSNPFAGFNGMDGSNPFGNFGQNMGGTQDNDISAETVKKKKKKRKKKAPQADIIDIDYEMEGGNRTNQSDEKHQSGDYNSYENKPKAIEAEVIDVDHEWK